MAQEARPRVVLRVGAGHALEQLAADLVALVLELVHDLLQGLAAAVRIHGLAIPDHVRLLHLVAAAGGDQALRVE